MPHLIHWCGFAGAWLLVIGPLQQAASELDEETRDLDEIPSKLRALPRSDPPSAWWWLLPPVAYVQRIHLRNRHRQMAKEALEPDEFERMERLADKARAWLFVAGGAFLIAITETWSLRESYRWDDWVFWALLVLMACLCAALTSLRTHRNERRRKDG
jgi:hypothetical protein